MRCFGYTDEGRPLPDEARLIRHMAQQAIEGLLEREIAAELNAAGHVTSAGGAWTGKTVSRLLVNPRLAGMRTYKGEVVQKRAYPQVLAEDPDDYDSAEATHKRLVETLNGPDRASTPPTRQYLLTGGLAKCGLCGSNLMAQRSNSKRRGMVCRVSAPYFGCGKIRIAAEPLEEDVARHVLARFGSRRVRERLAEHIGEQAAQRLREELDEVEEKLRKLGEDYVQVPLERETFLAAQKVLARERDNLQARLAKSREVESLPEEITDESLATWWKTADLERRRALVQVVLDHVKVGSATRPGYTGFDAGRVAYVWR
ncbi:recombinase family protein [Nonomuraea salmonea]|uniref:Recombinase family protein n=1 Tax=Nonomuraea salmonea TaxID=46181 RepID=A0ABV5P2Y9_9ACTN